MPGTYPRLRLLAQRTFRFPRNVPPENITRAIAAHIEAHQKEILVEWLERVMKDPQIPEARNENRIRVFDHFPQLLLKLIAMLRSGDCLRDVQSGVLAADAGQPRLHAKLHFEHGYRIESMLREISHLRFVLLKRLHGAGLAGSLDAELVINSSFDGMISMAAQILCERQTQLVDQVIEKSAQAIVVVSDSGDFQVINDAAKSLFGIQDEKITLLEWSQLYEAFDDQGRIIPQENFPITRAYRGEHVAVTFKARVAGGSEKWLDVSAVPLVSKDGENMGVLGIFQDVTARMSALDYMQKLAAFREQFVGILAHDLRNPLTAIMGYADLVMEKKDVEAAHFKSLTLDALVKIKKSSLRINHMISQVNDFAQSRLGSGIVLTLGDCNAAAICRQVVDELGVTYLGRRILVDVEGDIQGTWDCDRLMQVFSNLVANALRYSPQESVVRVSMTADAGNVWVGVNNAGKPIPPEHLGLLFEPFKQFTDTAREGLKEGLGLGLFIVKTIVEAHGGTIEVSSDDKRGTTFSLRLPKQPPDQPGRA